MLLENLVITPAEFFLYVIKPAFADLIPANMPYDGTLHEFTLMDNVKSKRNIIDIRRVKNILQRRDASCDIKYSKVAGTSTRQIETTELQAGVKHCKHELYQGALADWRGNDPLFSNKAIEGFFKDAVKTDIASNSYFGDVSRSDTGTREWSTTVYDGIFTWLKKYISGGVIPASQTFTIPAGAVTPTIAYNIIKALYDKQSVLMRNMPASEKAIYCSQSILDGYEEYLRGIGGQYKVEMYSNGVNLPYYNGVPIFPEPIWEPVMFELAGNTTTYAAVLTLRGNFVFATDKAYGEEDDFETPTALHMWREKKEMSWYWQMFLKAGTQIALPEHTIVGMSNFNL